MLVNFCAAVLLLIAMAIPAAAAEPGACTGCHDSAPVDADHPKIGLADVENCMSCHVRDGSDALFVHLHNHHIELGMPCGACHTESPSEDRLTELLRAE